MANTSGVRKGAWTYEEDNCLKAYILKHGVGKWHLIPERTGITNVPYSTTYLAYNQLK